MGSTEKERLADRAAGWKRWGPYLSERAWGTVREDYSEEGDAWAYFPHDHARSRAYRWSEDGLAGICNDLQELCLAFAFWNGRDPVLKERIFGLTGPEGNHGEDAKEYWWYVASTPTHSWMRWRWTYPQTAFPYEQLVAGSRARSRFEPEYELIDTGVFDGDRYWDVTVDYAKAGPDDILVRLRARNAGPDPAVLHVLPTLWFRNTWSWGTDARRPEVRADGSRADGSRADGGRSDGGRATGGRPDGGSIVAAHHRLGRMVLACDPPAAELLFCENESNARRLWGAEGKTPYPKDGIADHVVNGSATVNPARRGTKASFHHQLTAAPGATVELRLRLSTDGAGPGPGPGLAADFDATMARREEEADQFYAELTPPGASADEAAVMRQAFAGMLWSKQFYNFDVDIWLDGDPAGPPPAEARKRSRNYQWRHLNNADVISMPDKWEYPWYAAWDLAFHCVALAHVDVDFAKDQLLLMCREWYMHPNGQLPAYEWSFGDVNPPVHAWAALRVFEIDGSRDYQFLARALHKLLLNFTWWVNRKDADGNNVFEGGFLGLDNIGPIDRSAQLPVAGRLEQSDGTAWMGLYCLNLLEMALTLAAHDETYEDLATKFFEHFGYIASAIHDRGLWHEEDGFYYDVLNLTAGDRLPLRVRSMVGLLPLCATTTLTPEALGRLPYFAGHLRWFVANKPQFVANVVHDVGAAGQGGRLLSIVGPDRLRRILATMLSPAEFLSDHGLRALSAGHRGRPFVLDLGGARHEVGYEPGESTTGLFGGNSNWRGPVWFPLNYLIIEALQRFHDALGDDFLVEHPTGSGRTMNLAQVADDLSARLIGLFLDGPDGRRPVFGHVERFQTDPAWHGMTPFHEYFHGDTGMGLGASHQTGWTGLVADLITRRRAR